VQTKDYKDFFARTPFIMNVSSFTADSIS